MKLFFELNQNGGNEENNNENNEENNNNENNNEENNNEENNEEEDNEEEEEENNEEEEKKNNSEENNEEEENNNEAEEENNEEENDNEEENNLNEIISFLKDEKLSNNIINHLAENIELEIVKKISRNNDLVILTDKNNLKYKKIIKNLKNIKIAIISIVKVKDKKECVKYKRFSKFNQYYYTLYISESKVTKCKTNLDTIKFIKYLLDEDEEENNENNKKNNKNNKKEKNKKNNKKEKNKKNNKKENKKKDIDDEITSDIEIESDDENNKEDLNKNKNKNNKKEKYTIDLKLLENNKYKFVNKNGINILNSDSKQNEFNSSKFKSEFTDLPFNDEYLKFLVKSNTKVLYYTNEQIFINIDEKEKAHNTLRTLFQELFTLYLKDRKLNKKQTFISMQKFIKECVENEKCDDLDVSELKEKLSLITNSNDNNLNLLYSIFYDGSDFDHILYNKLNNIVIFTVYYYNEDDEFSASYFIYKNLKIYRFKPPRKYFNDSIIEKEIDNYIEKCIKNTYIYEKYNVKYKGLIDINSPLSKFKTIENTIFNNYLIFLIISNPEINIDNLEGLINTIKDYENKNNIELFTQFSNYLLSIFN